MNMKSFLIGKPLRNEAIAHQKYGVLWGLPILSSDAISSVAYAGEQILLVLLATYGLSAYIQLQYIIGAILGLLAILVFSYRQTIECYPNGGGAYIVAKDNLGTIAGVTAGSALAVDYILTVAVSVASGVEQITSAFLFLRPYSTIICVVIVLLLMVGNLRGIRESSLIFGVPTYLFIIGMVAMIFFGALKIAGGYNPDYNPVAASFSGLSKSALMFLMFKNLLRAFSNGCTALTGVEAVSNAVPNFKEPGAKHARKVLLMLGGTIFFILAGTTILAANYHVRVGGENSQAVIVQLAQTTFGSGFMFYYVVISTFVLLVLAANTAYSDFPLLLSLMAKDGYAPRQLSMRGDRLSFSNGIMMLSGAAVLLLIVFRAQVNALIGLYAIGVFISFTLSQFGMFRRWLRKKGKHWHAKAAINGLGAAVTAVVVVIIAIFKFPEGAWVVVILLPILVILMLKVKRHYIAIAKQLKVTDEELVMLDISNDHYQNSVIVAFDSINPPSIRALRFARTISSDVTAFCVVPNEEAEVAVRAHWAKLNVDIPFIIKFSQNRKAKPLLDFIESAEYGYCKGDIITVVLPQFAVTKWWHKLLHISNRNSIKRQLLKHKHIVVAMMPFHLKDDLTALGSGTYLR